MDPVKTINIPSGTIEILQDSDPENPRKWCEHLGTMICFHRHYDLGDKHRYRSDEFTGWEHMRRCFERDHLLLPLYLYDHSGITMSTNPFHCPWDSGQVGFIVVSKEKVREEYGVKIISAKVRDRALAALRSEVAVYDHYLTGDVYGFRILDKDGDEVDSCWGFYGIEHCEQQALAVSQHQPA